jgi:hypothetical protein
MKSFDEIRTVVRSLPSLGTGMIASTRQERGPLVTSRERKLSILFGLRPDLRSQMRLALIQGRVPKEGVLALIFAYKHGPEAAADALAAEF